MRFAKVATGQSPSANTIHMKRRHNASSPCFSSRARVWSVCGWEAYCTHCGHCQGPGTAASWPAHTMWWNHWQLQHCSMFSSALFEPQMQRMSAELKAGMEIGWRGKGTGLLSTLIPWLLSSIFTSAN
eukprot:Lithocolla_globosa_v1_NODE_5475_length_1234_cov_3.466497.p2 type:complete len:128 gc:universal NODE_5475_length_1234_cov_3.466497:1041-658(-)